MKRLLHLSALIALTFVGSASHAQKSYSNSVKLMYASFYVPGRLPMPIYNRQLGVAYERRVYKKFFAYLSLHRWENNVYEPFSAANMINGLSERHRYKMVDAGIVYKHSFPNTHHTINAGIGASYCWGTNIHWDNKVYYPMMDVFYVKSYNAAYYGIVPQISYDYNFLRNRLNAGVDLRARYYTGRTPGQYDYGVHLGVNF